MEVGGSLARGWPRKTNSEVIRRDLEEWKVSKEPALNWPVEDVSENCSQDNVLCQLDKQLQWN